MFVERYLDEATVAKLYNIDTDKLFEWITDRAVRFPLPRKVDGLDMWHTNDLAMYDAFQLLNQIRDDVDRIHNLSESLSSLLNSL